MPIACTGCTAPLPEMAAFCARCGRATGAAVAVRETTESLLRQMASLMQKHSRRGLVVKFVGTWGFTHESPKAKIAAVRFNFKTWIFESGPAFAVTPLAGKLLFGQTAWEDVRVKVFQEIGFDDARAFAEAYRNLTGRNVEIVKDYQ